MDYREIPFRFDCQGSELLGILAVPANPARIGVVIVVGGPQYRVGSHRQFVALARSLAAGGISCLRFDYRGMGDSDGKPISFEDTGPDIAAAIAALRERQPDLQAIILWGLCDGASACAFASNQTHISGMVLVNPWVRTDIAGAEATIRHYYARRIGERDFWSKLWSGRIDMAASVGELLRTLRHAISAPASTNSKDRISLPDRVGRCIDSHGGPVLVMLSGNDLTAAEFRLAARRPGPLRTALNRPSVSCVELPDADHTLSSARWRDEATAMTLDWLRACFGDAFDALGSSTPT